MSEVREMTIQFPYKRSLGPVVGAFMTALTEQRIIGIRNGDQVICPPIEWDPATGNELAHDFVDVGPAGTVESWNWVAKPSEQHPLDHPFAFALITLDGATTSILHAVDAGSIDAMSTGMRVAPRWKGTRVGHITDIDAFVPGEASEVVGDDTGPAVEPVEMMDYNASIAYTLPVTANELRAEQANVEGRFLGLKCPSCGRLYTGGRGFCPIDAIELGNADEVDLPQKGVITNYTIIEPVPYPGQTMTEPFARVMVLLDGADIVLGYQPTIDLPVTDLHIGIRVEAVWASDAELDDLASTAEGRLLGWIPTGEADVTDPELVNRIY